MHVTVHLAVEPNAVEEVIDGLRDKNLSARRTEMTQADGWCGVLVDGSSVLSRPAALREHTSCVMDALDAMHVAYRYVATELISSTQAHPHVWYVLRPAARALAVDLWLRGCIATRRRGLRRRLALSVLSAVFVVMQVSGTDFDDARRQANRIVPGGFLHADLTRKASGGWDVGLANIAVQSLPVFLPVALLAGLTTFLPPIVWIGLGAAWLLLLLVRLARARASSAGQRREGMFGLFFMAFLCTCLGLWLALSPAPPGDRGPPFLFVILAVLVAVGFFVEWRSRNLGKSLFWTLPLAFSALGGTAIVLGTLSYYSLLDGLEVPVEAVRVDAFDKAVAGLVALGIGASLALAVTAVYGLSRWMAGRAAVSNAMLSLALGMSALIALTAALGTGQSRAADLRQAESTDASSPPYFFFLEPAWVCVRPVDGGGAVEGGDLGEATPWMSFGIAESRYTLWRDEAGYRRVFVDDYDVFPLTTATRSCPGTSG